MASTEAGAAAVETLRGLDKDTLAMLGDLVAQSGWNQVPQDWALFSRLGSLCGVRDAGGKLVASGAVLPMGDSAAWISMILVAPAVRGQGWGRRVFAHCLRNVQDAGRIPMLDATPAGARLYSQFGFAPLWHLTRWQRDALPGATPAPPIASPAPETLATFASLDAEALGISREPVLADLMARADSRLVRSAGAAALVRTGRLAHHIGPLLATHEPAAAALVLDIARGLPGRVFIDVPDARTEFRRQLAAASFTPQRGLVRMALGEPVPAGQSAFIHAIAGPEFG
ncbi:MAG: family N-acetyltransferase [Variovorax sp.]|nr:family N-acetyltransferase [Variovorax sp.]